MENMTASERIRALMAGKPFDRMPVIEWAPWWNLTVDRWQREGLPCGMNVWEIQNHFGLDKCIQTLVCERSPETPVALRHGAGIMKTLEEYYAIRKTMYQPPETLYDKDYVTAMQKQRDRGDTIHFFTVSGFFWFARELFGIEAHLYSFYDYPELLHEMCTDYLAWLKKVFEYVGNTYRFDFMSFAEDMSYNLGPMLSKDLFDEFLAPYYREIIPIIKSIGIPVFIDSDGDITKAVDWYAEVGADGMFPLERQAGVDVSLYIRKQPQMTFLGHYDKMVQNKGEDAMRAEFERILPSAQKGKVIISTDHQTPPEVSYEDYKLYVRLLKEYAAKVSR